MGTSGVRCYWPFGKGVPAPYWSTPEIVSHVKICNKSRQKHHARITRLWCGILELSATSTMTLGRVFNLCATFHFFIFEVNFYFMSGEEVISIKISGVDGHSQKMYSSCYCCIIKVSSMNIRGCSCPTTQFKIGEKIKEKNPFPPSPPDPPCPCLLFST